MHPLVLHRTLLRFALALVGVFAWIFFFQFFYLESGSVEYAFVQVALLYALSALCTALLTPVAARALRNGTRRTMVLALFAIIVTCLTAASLFAGVWQGAGIHYAIACFAIAFGLYRAFYWIPYTVERIGNAAPRASRLIEFGIALAPALAGICIAWQPASVMWLFLVSAGLIVLSAVPLFAVSDVPEGFSWSMRRTFHELFAPQHRAFVRRAFFEGVVGIAFLLFWPLAIFLLLGWSYSVLGIVLSLTFILTILLRPRVRRSLRPWLAQKPLVRGLLAASPWVLRLTVAGPLSVVALDTYFYTTSADRYSTDPFTFEQFADGGSLIDEYTAMKEMSINLGRVAVCLLAAAVAVLTYVPLAFVAVFGVVAFVAGALAFNTR